MFISKAIELIIHGANILTFCLYGMLTIYNVHLILEQPLLEIHIILQLHFISFVHTDLFHK